MYANRRDQAPFTELEEGVEVRAGRVVFTIRSREVASDAVIVHGGVEFEMIGAPVTRGGPTYGLAETYFELYCERRSTTAEAIG